ncbi:MAG TPA: HNH endonuclease [Candidatus Bathyarchaeia archaeon]
MESLGFQRIKELFDYDPDTGEVSRKIKYGKRGQEGHIFESSSIKIDGKWVRIGRIAWVLHHEDWPPDGYWIDHINGIKADNRIVNLRLATPTQNQQNKAGFGAHSKGVTWRDRQSKPWQAKIRVNGQRVHLGSFATKEEASNAYREAALKYHGEFACIK